ncbi:MAG: heme A synthase [Flavobacterium sp.]|nr:MAG: heme A synthase [Flavobacterium sp.]
MQKYFYTSAKITLILVYVVILAGAMVRMTGSGMGCPDWPKCFGYYIPPSDIKELTWSPGREFKEGQVIIRNEALWVASDDFTTGAQYDPAHWRPYTKHDYAIFNPTHTWIEYVNRLSGALAGLATLLMAIFSLAYARKNKTITILSWLTVILMGFQGWLGATVVYSVLNPMKITLHMLVALIIVAIVLYILNRAKLPDRRLASGTFRTLLIAAIALSLIQILLGTQVRQFVDEQGAAAASVFDNPALVFYFHRSFSIVVFAVNFALFFRSRKSGIETNNISWMMALIVIEILSGVAMYYFDFPFGMQALHLMAAAILFGLQFWLLLRTKLVEKSL